MARNQYGLMVKIGETTVETWIYDRGREPAPWSSPSSMAASRASTARSSLHS